MRTCDKIIVGIATFCMLFNLFVLIPTFITANKLYFAAATGFITGFGYCGLLWCVYHEAFRRKNGL